MEALKELLSRRLGVRQGKNKISECVRLLHEISRREEISPEQALEESLEDSGLADEAHWPFPRLKQTLLKRRFPETDKKHYSSALLHELSAGEISAERKHIRKFIPSDIYIQQAALETPIARRVKKLFPEIPVVPFDELKKLYQSESAKWTDMGKQRLVFSNEPYDFLEQCPCTKQALLCNYHVLKLGMGCPYDCSYCYLQEYQNLKSVILPTNPETFLDELAQFFREKPGRFTRIGTGEYTDSLALDHITEYSKILVPFFKDKNVMFELKTKSNNIDNLLSLDHGGKTAIAWSLSPEAIAETEDWDTAPVADRLNAAKACQEAGYPIAFHFDPIIEFEGWKEAYTQLIDQIYSVLKPPIKWMSVGTLRFMPHLKPVVEKRHPNTRIFLGELFVDPMDKKMRYPTEKRISIYRHVLGMIKKHDPQVPVYLCMESNEVWNKVFSEGLPFAGRMDNWICPTAKSSAGSRS